MVFKDATDVLVNLLKARSSLGEPPAVPLTRIADPAEFYRDFYIAPIGFSSKNYTDLDISYFMQLPEQIHGTEKNLDKKRAIPDDSGSSFILAFVPSVSAPLSASIAHASTDSPAPSPSKRARGAMQIVEVQTSESEDE